MARYSVAHWDWVVRGLFRSIVWKAHNHSDRRHLHAYNVEAAVGEDVYLRERRLLPEDSEGSLEAIPRDSHCMQRVCLRLKLSICRPTNRWLLDVLCTCSYTLTIFQVHRHKYNISRKVSVGNVMKLLRVCSCKCQSNFLRLIQK